MTKNIVAIGGGGLQMEPDQLLLEKYMLELSGKPRPSVCFLPNATADALTYTLTFYTAMAELECRPSHLNLFAPPTADLESYLLEKDVIYVGGGNTKTMLATWREWHLDKILRQAWEAGLVLGGVSAGAICWFEQGLTDSIPGPYTALPCLGFLAGSCSPHYDSETERRPTYHRRILSGEMRPGIAIEDGVAVHYVDHEMQRVVSSRPIARAWTVFDADGKIEERPLDVTFLGAKSS
jgi:dipeptidase E